MFAPEIAPRLKNTAVRAGQQDACWTAHFEEHISTEAFSTNFAYVSIDLLTAHTNNRGRNGLSVAKSLLTSSCSLTNIYTLW